MNPAKKKGSTKKPKVKRVKCKKCGFDFSPLEVEPTKTWPFVSPMPDSEGRVTITQMATWKCPKCGATVRGSMGKTKGDFSGKSKRELIKQAITSGEKVDIESLANEMSVKPENLKKIIVMMIKKDQAKGKVEGKYFIPA